MPKMHEKSFDIIEAVEKGDWNVIDQFVAEGGDINASLRKTGPQAGYTALHFAIISGNYRFDREVLEKWIKTYGANVNCVGADGAQPIHLACLLDDFTNAEILLKYGADANAEFSKELVEKYKSSKDWKWSDEFGKMTLFVLGFINSSFMLLESLVRHKANIEITGKNNKTLLMYAVERESLEHLHLFIEEWDYQCRPEYLNARDDYGRHAVHYLLPNEKFGEFRYTRTILMSSLPWGLIEDGADINAMIDNDPDTLLLNKVAYRCEYRTLEDFLKLMYPYPAEGRPLYYCMIPVDPERIVENSNYRKEVEKKRNICLKLILETYTLRREFGIFVHEEDIKLMDQLIAKDTEVKKIVEDIQNDIINTSKTVSYSDSMSLYDVAIKAFNKRSLKWLVKNDECVQVCTDLIRSKFKKRSDHFWLFETMYGKIQYAYKRRKIMEKVEKISQLRQFIPFPYELTLMIIEYIDNYNLKNFVNSFYECPICE